MCITPSFKAKSVVYKIVTGGQRSNIQGSKVNGPGVKGQWSRGQRSIVAFYESTYSKSSAMDINDAIYSTLIPL